MLACTFRRTAEKNTSLICRRYGPLAPRIAPWIAPRRTNSTLPKLPVLQAIASHTPDSIAVVHSTSGRSFTYGNLLQDVSIAKEQLHQAAQERALAGERIAFLVENSYDYVVTLLSILSSNAIAVPISSSFPSSELQYILENSQTLLLLSSRKFVPKAAEVLRGNWENKPLLHVIEKIEDSARPSRELKLSDRSGPEGGMILYTSGTTSRPKGVFLPESVLTAQAASLQSAWAYSPTDHLLHVLPLHHIHGTMNALYTPLFSGSKIEFMYPFNANTVWERLAAPFLNGQKAPPNKQKVTFFTAVPTIWTRLLLTYVSLPPEIQKAATEAVSPANMRVNISGSAALPTPIKATWTTISHGNALLERYGMTEVGMALSCGLEFADRVDGSVGWPLPSVDVRLFENETNSVIEPGEDIDQDGREREGEIQIRGPTVFKEYWRNPEATEEEFVDDADGHGKWFKTGDIAVRRNVETAGRGNQDWVKGPMYFIKGRKSVDIIKTGGEKVSALEVERELLALPQISEAAVVGLPSEQWGQKVAAVIVLKPERANTGRSGRQWGIMDMRRALKDRLVNYKIPQELKVIDSIPRNAMGKINKKSLVREIFGEYSTNP